MPLSTRSTTRGDRTSATLPIETKQRVSLTDLPPELIYKIAQHLRDTALPPFTSEPWMEDNGGICKCGGGITGTHTRYKWAPPPDASLDLSSTSKLLREIVFNQRTRRYVQIGWCDWWIWSRRHVPQEILNRVESLSIDVSREHQEMEDIIPLQYVVNWYEKLKSLELHLDVYDVPIKFIKPDLHDLVDCPELEKLRLYIDNYGDGDEGEPLEDDEYVENLEELFKCIRNSRIKILEADMRLQGLHCGMDKRREFGMIWPKFTRAFGQEDFPELESLTLDFAISIDEDVSQTTIWDDFQATTASILSNPKTTTLNIIIEYRFHQLGVPWYFTDFSDPERRRFKTGFAPTMERLTQWLDAIKDVQPGLERMSVSVDCAWLYHGGPWRIVDFEYVKSDEVGATYTYHRENAGKLLEDMRRR